MLRAGLFANFKGTDTLLIWGDTHGMAELSKSIAALSDGQASMIAGSGMSILVNKNAMRPSELSCASDGLVWTCTPGALLETEGLLAGLEAVASGHQFIDITGLADQVIVAKNEYPETFRA